MASVVRCAIRSAREKLGTQESFNGGFVIGAAGLARCVGPEYGPFQIDAGQVAHHADFDRRFSADEEHGSHPEIGTLRHLPHAVSRPPSDRTARRSGRCPNRCRIRNG